MVEVLRGIVLTLSNFVHPLNDWLYPKRKTMVRMPVRDRRWRRRKWRWQLFWWRERLRLVGRLVGIEWDGRLLRLWCVLMVWFQRNVEEIDGIAMDYWKWIWRWWRCVVELFECTWLKFVIWSDYMVFLWYWCTDYIIYLVDRSKIGFCLSTCCILFFTKRVLSLIWD